MATADIIIRAIIVVCCALAVATKLVEAPASYLLLVLAVVFTFTSITGFCPIYASLKTGTFKQKKE